MAAAVNVNDVCRSPRKPAHPKGKPSVYLPTLFTSLASSTEPTKRLPNPLLKLPDAPLIDYVAARVLESASSLSSRWAADLSAHVSAVGKLNLIAFGKHSGTLKCKKPAAILPDPSLCLSARASNSTLDPHLHRPPPPPPPIVTGLSAPDFSYPTTLRPPPRTDTFRCHSSGSSLDALLSPPASHFPSESQGIPSDVSYEEDDEGDWEDQD
ncbi:hypothetical protein FB45DRAFT_1001663 [Roridomyces roridus]|uniref:Uncharacterized protein n=1 Tax=Roridomyces roridus TaxID=1738132 RepID=A0AAD7FPV2_9AGAR|nr:hypothetical protein FB45DRAFT_1001663 [Roridomyces roridus]